MGRDMVISSGKALISLAESSGAIISQHLWEVLIDADKCAPEKVEGVQTQTDNTQRDETDALMSLAVINASYKCNVCGHSDLSIK